MFLLLTPLNASPKIINGDSVNSANYPWMAELVDLNAGIHEFFCGGVLISSGWIVTAAHCMNRYRCSIPFSTDEIEIILNTYDLENQQERVGITKIIIHPDYDCNTKNSDIALLKLDDTSTELPALKISDSYIIAGTEALITGWGATDFEHIIIDGIEIDKPIYPNILQQLEINITADSECTDVYPDYTSDNMICASAKKNGGGTCIGDSGGPLVIQNNGWELIGITSWGYDECAVAGYPDVFTRVSEFRDFIYEHIGYPDMPYDYNGDQKIGLEDAVFVIRSIVVENSTEHDLSAAVKILQIMSGSEE